MRPGAAGGTNRGAVHPLSRFPNFVDRGHENLRRTFECGGQIVRGAEITLADVHTALGEVNRLGRIADADSDPVGGHAIEQVCDDGASKLASSPRDEDHNVHSLLLNEAIRQRLRRGTSN